MIHSHFVQQEKNNARNPFLGALTIFRRIVSLWSILLVYVWQRAKQNTCMAKRKPWIILNGVFSFQQNE